MCHISENVVVIHILLLQRQSVPKRKTDKMVQLLKEEQAQITQRIESLRKDVRTDIRHRTFYISALVSLEFDEKT